MTYNMTQLQQAYTLPKLFAYAETASGNILSSLMIIAIFIIMLLSMKRWDFSQSLLASSFACLILSLFMSSAGLLSFIWVLFFLSVLACDALYMWTVGRNQ